MKRDVPRNGRRGGAGTHALRGRRPPPPLPSSWVCTATWTQTVPRCTPRGRRRDSKRRPGRPRAGPRAASSAGSTPAAFRRRRPRTSPTRATTSGGCCTTPASRRGSTTRRSSSALLELGFGVTNAAARTTPGSGDLRRGDFDRPRLERLTRELRPRAIAFVGKEAYRGSSTSGPSSARSCGRSARHGPLRAAVDLARQRRRPVCGAPALVPRAAELDRAGAAQAVRAIVLDAGDRVLLCEFRERGDRRHVVGDARRRDRGRRERRGGPAPRAARGGRARRASSSGRSCCEREHVFPWRRRLLRQQERFHLVRVDSHEPAPTIDLAPEGVASLRWWTLAELERLPADEIAPPHLPRVPRSCCTYR